MLHLSKDPYRNEEINRAWELMQANDHYMAFIDAVPWEPWKRAVDLHNQLLETYPELLKCGVSRRNY